MESVINDFIVCTLDLEGPPLNRDWPLADNGLTEEHHRLQSFADWSGCIYHMHFIGIIHLADVRNGTPVADVKGGQHST